MRTAGKQYRVAPRDKIVVEKMAGEDVQRLRWATHARRRGPDFRSTAAGHRGEIIAQDKGDKVPVQD